MSHQRVFAVGTGRVPALDGVRGLAVLAVLAFHGGLPWARGGFLGVDAFFVLSGYLITSLLLAEWGRTRGIALLAFWGRRLRRLLPALLLMVTTVAVTARSFIPAEQRLQLRDDSFAALFYVANWRMALRGGDYFSDTAGPSPLEHTWSVGVEEQFYLLAPLLLGGAAFLGWAWTHASGTDSWLYHRGPLVAAASVAAARPRRGRTARVQRPRVGRPALDGPRAGLLRRLPVALAGVPRRRRAPHGPRRHRAVAAALRGHPHHRDRLVPARRAAGPTLPGTSNRTRDLRRGRRRRRRGRAGGDLDTATDHGRRPRRRTTGRRSRTPPRRRSSTHRRPAGSPDACSPPVAPRDPAGRRRVRGLAAVEPGPGPAGTPSGRARCGTAPSSAAASCSARPTGTSATPTHASTGSAAAGATSGAGPSPPTSHTSHW
ncbi:MAG: acyltransferase [Nocardioidaceae bacterium]|nr:acyltransferase [Nocardioidaceae bacterium]NUS52615.1 acyltransferase [Nocardioidaceae bacterium]